MSGETKPRRRTRAEQLERHIELLNWWAVRLNAEKHMPEAARARLDAWYAEHQPIGYSRSDWPGWGEFIDLDLFWPWEWEIGTLPGRAVHSVTFRQRQFDLPARGRFVLYRLWGEDQRLLYIGVSRNVPARIRTHQGTWGDLIVSVTTEEFEDAAAMFAAEREAIRAELPALNCQGVGS